MVVALDHHGTIHIEDDSWRMAGCGERCRSFRVRFLGRLYSERTISHDPYHHEAYGQNVLLREQNLLTGTIVRTGSLEVDGPREMVTVDGRQIHLTQREQGMLFFLASRVGHLCPQTSILRAAWGPEYAPLRGDAGYYRSPEAHLLRVNFARLRAKLGPARDLIQTIPGRGYRLLDVPPVDSGGSDG